MTVILRENGHRTEVVVIETDDPCLPSGARLIPVALPRSLEEDRRLLSVLHEPAWAGCLLTGIETPADIEKASALLRVAEADRNMKPSSLRILAVLDTVRAVLGLEAFNHSIPRLAGFIFDAETLAANASVAADSDLIMDLRLRLPLAARASETTAFLKVDSVEAETGAQAARNGYRGLYVTET